VHDAVVQTEQVDLGQVQADELCVKVCKGRVWQAMALAVPTRLWLGGAFHGLARAQTVRAVCPCY
jgi:hypothetical protein